MSLRIIARTEFYRGMPSHYAIGIAFSVDDVGDVMDPQIRLSWSSAQGSGEKLVSRHTMLPNPGGAAQIEERVILAARSLGADALAAAQAAA